MYLPVLHPFTQHHLLFLLYLPDTPMKQNQFGIWEPKLNVQNVLPLNELDILFTPLVAFDKQEIALVWAVDFMIARCRIGKISLLFQLV